LIYKDMLGALLSGPSGPTKLARICNVPFDRLAGYVSTLESSGLIRREVNEGRETFHLTQEGYKLHADMESMWNRLRI